MENQQNITAEPENALAAAFTFLSLFKFALPTMIMMIFNALYSVVDGVFISRFVSTDALSALNIVSPFFGLSWGIGAMITTGGNALIGKKMGENKNSQARQNFTLFTILVATIGVFFAAFGLFFMDRIILMLGADATLAPYCKEYLTIILIFMPACMLQVYFQNLLVTAGKPGLGMNLMFVAGGFNIVFDYIFVVPLNMGIGGAALATGIGFTIPALIGLLFFSRSKGVLHFEKPAIRLRELGHCLFNGSSEMVQNLSASITTFLFNIIMIDLVGNDGVAAITIIIYAQYMLQSMYLGYAIGIAPVFSYNYGSQNHAQLKKVLRYAIGMITLLTGITFLAALLLAAPLVGIFARSGTEVNLMATAGFRIFSLSFLFCGYGFFASGLFTALSNGKVSAILSFLRTFLFISAALLLLPKVIGLNGVWLAVPLAEFLAIIVAVIYLYRYRRVYHYF